MTKEERARENWKADYKLFGRGSAQELTSYQEYISITQGAGKSKARKQRTVPKEKIDRTGDLEGMSAAETFDLINQETEISRPLAQQERIETLNLL